LIRQRIAPSVRRELALAIALVLSVFGVLAASPVASAAISGQQGEPWGEFGTGPGQLMDPSFMGVDSTDGSVFVGSYPSFEFTETVIQKFSPAGQLEGSAFIPGISWVGIAVDHAAGRFYVLEDEEMGSKGFVATKILAFETNPDAGVLKPATPEELPVPDPASAEGLIRPQELVLDPSTGDLIVLAEDEAGHAVLQHIDTDGVGSVGTRWVDTNSAIGLPAPFNGGSERAIAVDSHGLTFVLNAKNGGAAFQARTLPANFTESSALSQVPGFADAVPGNELEFIALPPRITEGINFGPQIAVSTSTDGNDTLYWKSIETVGERERDKVIINGYSLRAEAKTVLYGGGVEQGKCGVETGRSALAAGPAGTLVVLDQGREVTEGESPEWFPVVSTFGPGGTECPAPAASFKLESGGSAVTTVPAGSSVTLNASASELHGATLAQAVWKVKGPEEFTLPAAALTTTASGRFSQEGTYTVRLIVETSPIAGGEKFGTKFSTEPQTLVVTAPVAGGEFPLNLTTSGTGSGTFQCKVEGGPAEACAAEYETGTEIEVVDVPGTGSEFATWTGACTGTAPCVITMSQAENVGAVFNLKSASTTEFTLTVTPPSGGTLLCNSGSGAATCAAQTKYASGKVVAVTAAPAAGFEFTGWTGDSCSGTGACSVTMTAAHTVGATFKAVSSGGGGGGNTGGGGGTVPPAGGGTVPPPGGGAKPHPKTPAQILAEKRQKAIAKCKKSKGKAKAQCLKKAQQIGKVKKKVKKKGVKAREFSRLVFTDAWQG
jgi:Divergent InlB B-repeat domain